VYQIPNTKNTGLYFLVRLQVCRALSNTDLWSVIHTPYLIPHAVPESLCVLCYRCDDLVDLSVQVSRFSRISLRNLWLSGSVQISDSHELASGLFCHNRTWMIRTGYAGNVKQTWDKRHFYLTSKKGWDSLSCEYLKIILCFLLILLSRLAFALQKKC